jgi:hypothetical protein
VRSYYNFVLAAGQSWPEAFGGREMAPFKWIRVHNRGGAQITASLDSGLAAASGDLARIWDIWDPGDRRVRNVRGLKDPPCGSGEGCIGELHIFNNGSVATTVYVETDMDPIVDLEAAGAAGAAVIGGPVDAQPNQDAQIMAALGMAWNGSGWDRVRNGSGAAAGKGLAVNLQDGGTSQLLGVVFVPGGSDAVVGQTFAGLWTQAYSSLFNGTTWDRFRSAGLGVAAVGDISQFNTESTVALGAAATFTGPWRDTLNYNWFAALALSDQAGTLLIDEADAATPNFTNLVQSQATAATPANQPSPPAAGQVARIAPTKSLLRFMRVRYINGATLQARFALASSLSPLN